LIPALRDEVDRHGADQALIVGIGGGAALDLAKALGAMATNRHFESVRDGLEGVGRGLTLEHAPISMLAIPTTAGTGSECTKNSVISSNENDVQPFKKSLRSNRMVPDIVLVDPELSVSVPPDITAFTGMDAITQLIESAISCRARPVTTALAMHGLELAVGQLERAVLEPDSREAREAVAHAAYLSGITLANSGLGMAHGVAPALGILADVPHGLACAVMLPAALEANRSIKTREIAVLARLLTDEQFEDDDEAARAAPQAVLELQKRIGISPRLRDLGVTRDQIPAIVAGSRGNSMNGNPRTIEDNELTRILENMF
jgi:alcohol dehydrogenase class IV